MDAEQRGLEALNNIEARLATRERGILDKDVLCAKYKEIREFLEDALDLVGKFPFIGKKVVGFVELLMEIADTICGIDAE